MKIMRNCFRKHPVPAYCVWEDWDVFSGSILFSPAFAGFPIFDNLDILNHKGTEAQRKSFFYHVLVNSHAECLDSR